MLTYLLFPATVRLGIPLYEQWELLKKNVLAILAGIVGNLLAVSLCKLLRITNPIAKGIAIGTSSHAIGTSKALEIGQVEGAMSSLSIAVAGILTAVLCPITVNLLPM